MKKICPRCSSSFSCREDRYDLCQCAKTFIATGVRDYVKDEHGSCLCPECLKEANASFHSFGINPKYAVKKNA